MKNAITISHALKIKATQETVWNFTQNFDSRSSWDKSIVASELIQKDPVKLVRLKMAGGMQTILQYKLCRKPFKTSLVMTNTKSFVFVGGGGAWTYKSVDDAVEWTQTNTLIVKNAILYWCFGSLIKTLMKKQAHMAMLKAKHLIESNSTDLKLRL